MLKIGFEVTQGGSLVSARTVYFRVQFGRVGFEVGVQLGAAAYRFRQAENGDITTF